MGVAVGVGVTWFVGRGGTVGVGLLECRVSRCMACRYLLWLVELNLAFSFRWGFHRPGTSFPYDSDPCPLKQAPHRAKASLLLFYPPKDPVSCSVKPWP